MLAARLVPLALLLPAVSAQTSELVWETTIALSSAFDVGRQVVPTADGGAFVRASATIGGVPRTVLLRLDPTGEELWRTEPFPLAASAIATGMCTDGADGVFVGGRINGTGYAGPSLGQSDALLIRVDANGATTWARRVGGSQSDRSNVLHPDGAGGCYLAGYTNSPAFGAGPQGDGDAFVSRLDGTGAEIWTARVGQPGRFDEFEGLCPDGAGGLFCVGQSGSTVPFNFDPKALRARIDSTGQALWSQRELDDFSLYGVTSDGAGGAVASGRRFQPDSGSLIRFDGTGALVWAVELIAGADFTLGWEVERLTDDTFLVGGFTRASSASIHTSRFLARYDGTGATVEATIFDPSPSQASALYETAIDGRGGAWITGYVPDGIGSQDMWIARVAVEGLGAPVCLAQPNSTGAAAETRAVGSPLRSEDALTVYATGMPEGTFGYLIASTTPGFMPNAGGSQGDLCLGGSIGRLNRSGEILNAGPDGRFHILLDLDDMPTPTGSTSVLAGQNWDFQAWYRDVNPGPTSNFSASVRVVLN